MSGITLDGQLLLAADEAVSSAPGGWTMLLVLVVIFVLPFALAAGVARVFKLQDLWGKMGGVLFAVVLGLSPFVYHIAQGEDWRNAIRLGIDLAGGTNLVYEVDREGAAAFGKEVDTRLMDQMVGAIGRRINPSGTEEVTVRRVGSDRIEIIIPGADSDVVEQKKNLITKLGSLQFDILANQRDHKEIIRQGMERPPLSDVRIGGRVVATWREVSSDEPFSEHGEVVTRQSNFERADGTVEEGTEVLCIVEPVEDRRVTGRYLSRADQTMDENGGPAVGFNFNQRGAFLFSSLTTQNRPSKDGFMRRLAIVLDGKVHSAPNLREAITGGSGQISGRFTQEEIQQLINVLNAGALEVPLKRDPISEFTISPLLGSDVQEKGKLAITVSAVVVFVFMAFYYLKAGLIANLCLLLDLVLVLGTMAFIDATFTLPGLAGLVLTIGMAVDANVLIFERMREEVNRGSSLRMAIRNGFDKALSTIVDANVTTLITAVVLYAIGSDQVRGFAVTLFIGIVISMWAALYVGRLCFEICERKRWITDLKMFSVIGETHINFLGKRAVAYAGSAILISVGLICLYARGADNLDIDFSGGTMVTFEFVEPQETDEIRNTLAEVFGSSITLEHLTLTGEDVAGFEGGRRFRLRTTEQDTQAVRKGVDGVFKDSGHELVHVTMGYGEITAVASPEDANPADAAATGGYQVSLTFSEPVRIPNMEELLSDSLAAIAGPEGQPKYDRTRGLFELTGTGGPGLEVDAGQVRKYTEMKLQAQPVLAQADLQKALADMAHVMETTPKFDEVNSFASSVAREMQESALLAMLVSIMAIVAYIWFRFEHVTFGLAAVVALVHDVLVVVGMVAIASLLSNTAIGTALDFYDFRINLPMIAAFLTIIGYSLNDTIVVFDRVREIRGKNPAVTADMINASVNQTLSRTLLTSLTTLLVVGILYTIGGEGIHGFAFCLVVGVVVGTYSTIYIANPALLWLFNRGASHGKKRPAGASGRAA